MRLKHGILALLLTTFLCAPAHALVGFSIVGAASKDHASGQWGLGGGGLIAVHHTTRRFSLESGALIFNNKYANSESASSIYVPVTLNFHFRHFILFGGGYYNHFTKSGADADYGWKAGIRFGHHHLFVDGAFSQGLKSYGGTYYSAIICMLGYRLGIL